jgi:hypothetical protein
MLFEAANYWGSRRAIELSPSEFLKAVESLRRRLLIEKVQKGDRTLFTVQRAIAEYIKTHILEQF